MNKARKSLNYNCKHKMIENPLKISTKVKDFYFNYIKIFYNLLNIYKLFLMFDCKITIFVSNNHNKMKIGVQCSMGWQIQARLLSDL